MRLLETGYSPTRSSIVMRADLKSGFREQKGKIVFYEKDFLPYAEETKFNCRLKISADISARDFTHEYLPSIELRQTDLQASHSETRCSVTLMNGIFEVVCPLISQRFNPSKTTTNPTAYFYLPDFRFRKHTAEEIRQAIESKSRLQPNCAFLFEYWLSIHGPASMFVKDQYEKFERGVISGGRPESNRRRF
jgi:hypothetical protein